MTRHQLLGRPFARLLKHNSEPERRVVRETKLRGGKVPRAFLSRKEGRKSPKLERLQVWSLRREFVRPMKGNPGAQKRALRKTRLFSKSFRPR